MSSISISVSAAGMAIATRITAGMAVQITSAVVLCVNFAGFAPADFRNRTIATDHRAVDEGGDDHADPEDQHVQIVDFAARSS